MTKGDEQKQRIRRAAAKLWAKQGYHAASVDELCSATDLGKGALYYHIGSKEELLYEISIRSVMKLIEGEENAMAFGLPASGRLRQMSRRLMRSICDDLPEWSVFFREVNTLRGRRRAEVLEKRKQYEKMWADVLEQGQRSGEFRATTPIFVKGVLGMHNYAYLWLRRNGPLKPEQIADVFCDVLLGGLLNPAHHTNGLTPPVAAPNASPATQA